jgi:hypothetical protein
MKKTWILIVIALILLTTVACSFTVNLPTVETGPDQTYTIHERLRLGPTKPTPSTNLPRQREQTR